MKKLTVFLTLALTALFLSGCAKNISADEYNADNANTVQRVESGIIASKRIVTVDDNNGVGTIAGAIAGGVLGSTIGGSGAANMIGATAGAVGGGYLGSQAESSLNRQKGIEYIIKLNNGNTISMVQGLDNELAVGQHVLVIFGEKSRIVADTTVSVPVPAPAPAPAPAVAPAASVATPAKAS